MLTQLRPVTLPPPSCGRTAPRRSRCRRTRLALPRGASKAPGSVRSRSSLLGQSSGQARCQGPGELPVICRPPSVVPSAQFVDHDHVVDAAAPTVALRSRRLEQAHDCSPSIAIVPQARTPSVAVRIVQLSRAHSRGFAGVPFSSTPFGTRGSCLATQQKRPARAVSLSSTSQSPLMEPASTGSPYEGPVAGP